MKVVKRRGGLAPPAESEHPETKINYSFINEIINDKRLNILSIREDISLLFTSMFGLFYVSFDKNLLWIEIILFLGKCFCLILQILKANLLLCRAFHFI